MTSRPEPPPVRELSHAQYSGWACCWCGKSLLDVTGAVIAGTSRGSSGAHILDIEVYACGPWCPQMPWGGRAPQA